MNDDAVTVAYVHPNEVAHSWHMSLVDLLGHDLTSGGRVVRGGWIAVRCGTDGLPGARNKAVEQFLDEKDADWLFWVDTDMGFAPDTVDRLIAVADPTERPIVGALCFAQREKVPDGLGGYHCAPAATIFDWVEVEGSHPGFLGRSQYPINKVVRCAGTGSACILIHRSVFEKIHAEQGPTWYNRVTLPGKDGPVLLGEDLSFCVRAGAVDVPVHVDTSVKTSHLKQFWLAEHHYWDFAIAPPAPAETAVIVPVLKRPQNAEPFMRSLRASTGLATVYAICDPDDDDTIKAWEAAGARVMFPSDMSSPGTFAEKVNRGYQFTSEPWLFITGDDVEFHPGWLDHAQVHGGDRYHVVGTNDLGNPRVTSGEHATHLLIRRSYVDEQGASWDGPGVVCHEGYRHWFVDDEMVTVAKQRDVWTMALSSKVEHMHPAWEKGNQDEVYELGQSHAKIDQQTFMKRCRANGGKR